MLRRRFNSLPKLILAAFVGGDERRVLQELLVRLMSLSPTANPLIDTDMTELVNELSYKVKGFVSWIFFSLFHTPRL